jgi:hypothetical protein
MNDKIQVQRSHQIALEFGGLRVEVYYTQNFGASVRVFGASDPTRELLRFDDFVDTPHYHAPADNPEQINLDVSRDGEPREFFLHVIDEQLVDILAQIGFGDVVGTLDVHEIRRHLSVVRAAMDSVLVEGFHRTAGKCLQDSDPERPSLRDEANARFEARLRALRDGSPTATV